MTTAKLQYLGKPANVLKFGDIKTNQTVDCPRELALQLLREAPEVWKLVGEMPEAPKPTPIMAGDNTKRVSLVYLGPTANVLNFGVLKKGQVVDVPAFQVKQLLEAKSCWAEACVPETQVVPGGWIVPPPNVPPVEPPAPQAPSKRK